ncbi:hypothetical protein OIU77_022147 [Salix suchowensis]|uniref:Uncharacterized protein n=1 Tax=Salix suchowensis TaxID=1278906 RepID=A0ABQ8ZGT2_9ROSI|nr:hypothetical protein OIU77_022147 [Salix suchowensis]
MNGCIREVVSHSSNRSTQLLRICIFSTMSVGINSINNRATQILMLLSADRESSLQNFNRSTRSAPSSHSSITDIMDSALASCNLPARPEAISSLEGSDLYH